MNSTTDIRPVDSAENRKRGHRWPWILITATTIVALAGAAAYVGLRSTSYEATADVLVTPLASEDPNFQGLPLIRESSDGSRPVQTGAGLLSGPAIARLTADHLGGEWTRREVEGDVVVQPRGESNIVAIVAKAGSASSSAELANVYTSAALKLRRHTLQPYFHREIEILTDEAGKGEQLKQLRAAEHSGDPTLSVAARAQAPSASAGPSTKLILLIALIVGLLVGVGGVMVINVARTPSPTAR